MPVTVFRQEKGKFVDRTAAAGLANTNGWWNTVTAVDLRGDGHIDLVLGNLGLNSYLRASTAQPARLYIGDFAHNGALEQVLTFFKNGVSYPIAGRDELVRLIPALRSKYASYKDFGASRVEDIFPAADLEKAKVLDAKLFASSVALDKGNGTFEMRPLPVEAQFAPVFAALADDFDGDGRVDVIVAGNFNGVTPVQGRYDASHGLLLRGAGTGALTAVDATASNLVIDGQVRHMKALRAANGGRLVLVARNDSTVQVLRIHGLGTRQLARAGR
jgi:hypothetical protein